MGQALYRKYRSKNLDEIVGQSHITDMLKRAIAQDRISHAYLLTGPRGVGKTSIARILAHEINHLPYSDESAHLDIIEIDAASNNSVEDIRTLREKIQVAPVQANKKIYIIDEVHMLSKSAFNALLKTLEEPPEHIVFILATTNAEKLPATIISRVQRFNFRAITPTDAATHLRTIADQEHIAITDEALALIARHGKGSFRDSISLLDQLRNLSDDDITADLIRRVLGLADEEMLEQLLDAYARQDVSAIVSHVDTLEAHGTPAALVAEQLIQLIRPKLATDPGFMPLIDRLLDISKSSWPHIKLLTALSSGIAPQPIERSAPVAATAPASPAVAPAKPTAAPKPSPAAPKNLPAPSAPAPSVVTKVVSESSPSKSFPWDSFIDAVKTDSTGLYAILAKSGHHFDGSRLLIYAGNNFNKARLERSLKTLAAALETSGIADGHVEISNQTIPPKDSQTAAILDLMGGGQEVSI